MAKVKENVRKLFHMKKVRIVALVLALAVCGGIVWAVLGRSSVSAAEVNSSLTKETTVERGDIITGISESGTVAPATESVTLDISATVETVNVTVGQEVAEGDVLATLSSSVVSEKRSELELAYSKLASQLKKLTASKDASLAQALADYETNLSYETAAATEYNLAVQKLQDTVDSAQASLDQAKTARDSAAAAKTKAYDTWQAFLSGSVSSSEVSSFSSSDSSGSSAPTTAAEAEIAYNEAVSALAAKEAAVTAAETKLQEAQHAQSTGTATAEAEMNTKLAAFKNAKSLYDVAVAEINQAITDASNQASTAKTALDDFNAVAGDGTIVAPCTGTVMTVSATEGSEVSANMALFTVTNSAEVNVSVSIAQEDVVDLSVGQSASVQLDAFETPYDGVISSIAVSPSREGASTVSYTVTVLLSGNDVSKLYQGMTGTVTFITKSVSDVLYVSNKAITQEGTKEYVQRQLADGTVEKVEITTGFSDGRNVEIQSGLSEGDVCLIASSATAQE
ncbi:MAG: HlyD family efflux transporter periplasmic adaptor subunit [Oscillospiraceae bacterium]